jgi:hypothetical protein
MGAFSHKNQKELTLWVTLRGVPVMESPRQTLAMKADTPEPWKGGRAK